jgi:hypothetical protein
MLLGSIHHTMTFNINNSDKNKFMNQEKRKID